MSKFSVGDRVRVMTPGELAESEGAELFKDGYGYWYINFEHGPGFVGPMEEYCGEVGTIVGVEERYFDHFDRTEGYCLLEVEFDNESLSGQDWNFSDYMFVKEEEAQIDLPDVNQLYIEG